MDAGEVVVHQVQRHGPSVVLDLLREGVGEAREAPASHAHRQVIATLESGEGEFTVPEIVSASKEILRNSFSPSHAVQILGNLTERGFVYRNRRGAYCFAVPLLAQFIRRQNWDPEAIKLPLSSANGPGPLP